MDKVQQTPTAPHFRRVAKSISKGRSDINNHSILKTDSRYESVLFFQHNQFYCVKKEFILRENINLFFKSHLSFNSRYIFQMGKSLF